MMLRNFSHEELACPCCQGLDLDPKLLTRLQALRDILGYPLQINSGYRCPDHNAKIGGSKTSQHLLGKALDISTRPMSGAQKHQFLRQALALRFSGVGVYQTFIHIDVRDDPSFWVG